MTRNSAREYSLYEIVVVFCIVVAGIGLIAAVGLNVLRDAGQSSVKTATGATQPEPEIKRMTIEEVRQETREHSERNAERTQSSLETIQLAFVDHPSQDFIKAKLDLAMQYYGVEINEENYLKCASALVVLRKDSGFTEMQILDHMIRSHVVGVNMHFADMAAISATALEVGDL
jgi:hypothetical protein